VKIGVTGANGFIGQHIVAAVRERGDDAVAIIRNRSPSQVGETRFFDFSQSGAPDAVLAGLDGVIHAAAHIPKSYADPNEARLCMQVNALGTLELLLACNRVGIARAVVLSGNVYRPGTIPLTEDGPIDPSTQAPYYLISKAAGDLYAQAVGRERKVGVTILRPSAVYGPGLTRGMIPTFIAKLQAGQRVTIQNGGRYRADMVYVADVAAASVAALRSPSSGPFNVGSGTTSSALEIAHSVARRLNAAPELIEVLPMGDTKEVLGFSPLDISLARTSLGYEPRDVETGLGNYLDWWRALS
jgi:UDP-glucose 4-epimerase